MTDKKQSFQVIFAIGGGWSIMSPPIVTFNRNEALVLAEKYLLEMKPEWSGMIASSKKYVESV